ncbi:unnamed protein product, partial [marine sediment metagenome]
MRRKQDVTVTPAELAKRVGGQVDAGGASAQPDLSGVATLDDAGPADVSFLTSECHLAEAEASRAAAFLAPGDLRVAGRPCIAVENVWKALLAALDVFWPDEPAPAGVHASAVVDRTARVGDGVSIGPLTVVEAGAEIGEGAEIGAQCYIGRDARVGAGSLLYVGVKVLERVQVGGNAILHSGVVLGTDGWKYEVIDGVPKKIPQVGTVVIEDGVEIGANSCVDRAFLGETRVGAACGIDNLVQIGHNCRIGPRNFICSQVGISGSVKTGAGCIFWGQVGIADGATIGDRATVNGQSGVRDDIPVGGEVFGSPALPMGEAA